MQPISLYQSLFAQTDVTHAIVDFLMRWPVLAAFFLILVSIRMFSGHRLKTKKVADQATLSSRQS